MDSDRPLDDHIAYCPTCDIKTEDRHSEMSASKLCELHNESRDGCDARPVPVCWVCFEPATRQNTNPPHEYTCEEHAISIDAKPIDEANLNE